MTLRRGQKIRGLTVQSEIGSGTTGTLYKVRGQGGKVFALKVLEFAGTEWKDRFEKEFHILNRCDHPSIAKVYSHGAIAGEKGSRSAYVVTDYLEGASLAKLMDRKPGGLTVEKATKLIRKAAEALEHAHSLSLVHRDLKPGNIFIRRSDGELVIVDFGVAKDFAKLDSDLTFFAAGARGFSCYHKMQHPREATYSDDIWSLGAVYYFLLTGKPPFDAETEPALVEKIKQGEYPDVKQANPKVPEEIAMIVRKMLDDGQTAGYPNCRYLLGDLDRLDMFIAERNKVFISQNLASDRVSTYQMLFNKIYGPVNSRRTAYEIFSRLTFAMGRANAQLLDFQSRPGNPGRREDAIERLTQSFFWLCSFALKTGIDLESAVWFKFPGICPYCLAQHGKKSTCSKATKGPIDIWRLRDLANENFNRMPRALREWERMFANIYPATTSLGFEYLSKKLIEELGEVGGELTRARKRVSLLQEAAIDSLAFEVADIFAWICQVSNALRSGRSGGRQSVLAASLAARLKYEICPFCKNPICTCELEHETDQKKMEYRYLD